MILYLLKSAACLIILLLVHRLFLQREAIYQFNRFYLLAAVIGSFLIPMVEIEVPAVAIIASPPLIVEPDFSANYQEMPSQESEGSPVFHAVEAEEKLNWSMILWFGYGLITLIFFIRFVRNISLLVNKINKNVHITYRGETLVLLNSESLPFSFLSYIFVSKGYFENNQLTDAIFAHEQAHVRGRHTWDNLLIEALLVPLWFHPGLYLARQAIKLNHEFIADSAALQITPLEHYKTFLLAMMLPDQNPGLVSSLNFSLTKKRFEMMKRQTANSTKWIKILLVVPVLGALVYFFSEKVTIQAEAKKMSQVHIFPFSAQQSEKEFDLTIYMISGGKFLLENYESTETHTMTELLDIIQQTSPANPQIKLVLHEGNTMGDMEEAKSVFRALNISELTWINPEGENLVERLNEDKSYKLVFGLPIQQLTKEEYYSETKFQVKNPDGKIEEFNYANLPNEYKKNLPNPPGEISKLVPSSELFESWKNEEEFAIWIDGKVVPNSKLKEMKASDIAYYNSSFVHANARSARFPQNYQVQLYTLAGFDNTYGKNSNFGKKPMGGTITFGSVEPKNNKLSFIPASVPHQYIPSSSAYQKQATEFQLKITKSGIFTQPSNEEIEELRNQFLALDQAYFNLSMDERRKVSRVSFPYAKIEKDGQISYKKFELLTDEERKALGC
jgi:hypothetical protein